MGGLCEECYVYEEDNPSQNMLNEAQTLYQAVEKNHPKVLGSFDQSRS